MAAAGPIPPSASSGAPPASSGAPPAAPGAPGAPVTTFKEVLDRLTKFNAEHEGSVDMSGIMNGLNGQKVELERLNATLKGLLSQIAAQANSLTPTNYEKVRSDLKELTGKMAKEINGMKSLIPSVDGAARGGFQYKKSKSRTRSKSKHSRRTRRTKSKSKSKHSRRTRRSR